MLLVELALPNQVLPPSQELLDVPLRLKGLGVQVSLPPVQVSRPLLALDVELLGVVQLLLPELAPLLPLGEAELPLLKLALPRLHRLLVLLHLLGHGLARAGELLGLVIDPLLQVVERFLALLHVRVQNVLPPLRPLNVRLDRVDHAPEVLELAPALGDLLEGHALVPEGLARLVAELLALELQLLVLLEEGPPRVLDVVQEALGEPLENLAGNGLARLVLHLRRGDLGVKVRSWGGGQQVGRPWRADRLDGVASLSLSSFALWLPLPLVGVAVWALAV